MERGLGSPAQSGDSVDAKPRPAALLVSARFLGELVAHGLAGGPLMLAVAEELLAQSSSPIALEMLAAFLTICAASFDRPAFKRHADLEKVFHGVERAVRSSAAGDAVAMRACKALSVLLQLRGQGWQKPASQSGGSKAGCD